MVSLLDKFMLTFVEEAESSTDMINHPSQHEKLTLSPMMPLVMACLDNYSEYEYLERILQDAICTEPIAETVAEEQPASISEKYQKYQSKHYEPTPHEYVEYKTKNTYSKDPIAGKASKNDATSDLNTKS